MEGDWPAIALALTLSAVGVMAVTAGIVGFWGRHLGPSLQARLPRHRRSRPAARVPRQCADPHVLAALAAIGLALALRASLRDHKNTEPGEQNHDQTHHDDRPASPWRRTQRASRPAPPPRWLPSPPARRARSPTTRARPSPRWPTRPASPPAPSRWSDTCRWSIPARSTSAFPPASRPGTPSKAPATTTGRIPNIQLVGTMFNLTTSIMAPCDLGLTSVADAQGTGRRSPDRVGVHLVDHHLVLHHGRARQRRHEL